MSVESMTRRGPGPASARTLVAFACAALATLQLLSAPGATAQDSAQVAPPPDTVLPMSIPSDLERIELARSRECVSTIARVEEVNAVLQPIGARAERAQVLMQAILLEERSIMAELDQTDPLEAEVHGWFVADGRLAQSYVDTQNEDLQRQRTIGREAIKGRVQAVIADAQAEAVSTLEESGDLNEMAAVCDGAILVRPEVIAACSTQESPVCEKATVPPDSALPYRFVDRAADMWSVEELRPWSTPQGLTIGPDGSLGGARSTVVARKGNVAVSVAFSPLIHQRNDLEPDVVAELDALLDTLEVEFEHPEIVFAPSLGVRATLPQALGNETRYILHFGPPDTADIVWIGEAESGAVLEDIVVVGPSHIQRLISGAPLTLTALIDLPEEAGEEAAAEVSFMIPFTSVNQIQSTGALIGYMIQQLPGELMQLFPVNGATGSERVPASRR